MQPAKLGGAPTSLISTKPSFAPSEPRPADRSTLNKRCKRRSLFSSNTTETAATLRHPSSHIGSTGLPRLLLWRYSTLLKFVRTRRLLSVATDGGGSSLVRGLRASVCSSADRVLQQSHAAVVHIDGLGHRSLRLWSRLPSLPASLPQLAGPALHSVRRRQGWSAVPRHARPRLHARPQSDRAHVRDAAAQTEQPLQAAPLRLALRPVAVVRRAGRSPPARILNLGRALRQRLNSGQLQLLDGRCRVSGS